MGEANGLAVGVGAVELADGEASVARVLVGYEGGTLRAVGAVVEEAGGDDCTNAVEKFLDLSVSISTSRIVLVAYSDVVLCQLVVEVVYADSTTLPA